MPDGAAENGSQALFFQQKTRREAAKELGITSPAVSAILSQAARRLRKQYPDRKQAVAAV